MEPNKMEKDFKEKLEQRTIQPSEMAWDRLDAMLSVAENKKPKKSRAWMYMAAAFLVFFLVGIVFLNQGKENNGLENDQNSVVTTKDEQPQITTETERSQTIIAPVTNEEAVAVQNQPSINQYKKADTPIAGKIINSDKIKGIQAVQQDVVATTEKKEAVAIIQVNDVEKLLAVATSNNAPKKKSTIKIDPNLLLSSVEEELDDSFRDRVLIGTVNSFKAVRSAVANRNYQ